MDLDKTLVINENDSEELDFAILELDDMYASLKKLKDVRTSKTNNVTEIDEGIGTAERKKKSAKQLTRSFSQIEVVIFDKEGEYTQTITEEKQQSMKVPPFPVNLNNQSNFDRAVESHSRGFERSSSITFNLPPRNNIPTPKPRRNPFIQYDSDSDYDEVPAENDLEQQNNEPTYTSMQSMSPIPDYEEVPDKLDDLNYTFNNTFPYKQNQPPNVQRSSSSISALATSPKYGMVNFAAKTRIRNISPEPAPVVLQMNRLNSNNGILNLNFQEDQETKFGTKTNDSARAEMTSDDEWDEISVDDNNEREDHTSAQYRDGQAQPNHYIYRNSMEFDPNPEGDDESERSRCSCCHKCCQIFMTTMVIFCLAIFLGVLIFYIYLGVENEKYLAVWEMKNGNGGG